MIKRKVSNGKYLLISLAVILMLLALALPVSAAKPEEQFTKTFVQCADDTYPPGTCTWINGIIQSSNSEYYEGMSVPQKAMFTGISATSGNVHTLKFDMDNTKAGTHSYDFKFKCMNISGCC